MLDRSAWMRGGYPPYKKRDHPMSANQTAAAAAPVQPVVQVEERQGEGHGRRLTAAFDALVGGHRVPLADVVETVESDIALVVAVLRVANDLPTRGGVRVDNIPDCV